ncbi:hypothetical protein GCM10023080_074170 [Streptomyces pseudoechinosporeus]
MQVIAGTWVPVEKGMARCLAKPMHEVIELVGHARCDGNLKSLGQPEEGFDLSATEEQVSA